MQAVALAVLLASVLANTVILTAALLAALGAVLSSGLDAWSPSIPTGSASTRSLAGQWSRSATLLAPGQLVTDQTYRAWVVPGRVAAFSIGRGSVSRDGGEPRRGQTLGPRETQEGAATPGQGASLAAGNVAEPQLGPGRAARAETRRLDLSPGTDKEETCER